MGLMSDYICEAGNDEILQEDLVYNATVVLEKLRIIIKEQGWTFV